MHFTPVVEFGMPYLWLYFPAVFAGLILGGMRDDLWFPPLSFIPSLPDPFHSCSSTPHKMQLARELIPLLKQTVNKPSLSAPLAHPNSIFLCSPLLSVQPFPKGTHLSPSFADLSDKLSAVLANAVLTHFRSGCCWHGARRGCWGGL